MTRSLRQNLLEIQTKDGLRCARYFIALATGFSVHMTPMTIMLGVIELFHWTARGLIEAAHRELSPDAAKGAMRFLNDALQDLQAGIVKADDDAARRLHATIDATTPPGDPTRSNNRNDRSH